MRHITPDCGVLQSKECQEIPAEREYGSARWGNAKDIEPYMDSVFENNVFLTQTERLMMSGRPSSQSMREIKIFLLSVAPVPARHAFL